MELTPIDFIAQLLNRQKGKEQGDPVVVRWTSLREDLKLKYKSEAEQLFNEWKEDEEEAQRMRESIMKDANIIKVNNSH